MDNILFLTPCKVLISYGFVFEHVGKSDAIRSVFGVRACDGGRASSTALSVLSGYVLPRNKSNFFLTFNVWTMLYYLDLLCQSLYSVCVSFYNILTWTYPKDLIHLSVSVLHLVTYIGRLNPLPPPLRTPLNDTLP